MAATYRLKLGNEDIEIGIEPDGAGGYRATLRDQTSRVSLVRISDSARYSLIVDNRPYELFAEESPTGFHFVLGGSTIDIGTQTGRRGKGGGSLDVDIDGEWVLKSPMSGVVQSILVSADDEVSEGQVVIVVEAMKMQNELHARRAGTVKAVYVSVGQRVDQGTPLLVVL